MRRREISIFFLWGEVINLNFEWRLSFLVLLCLVTFASLFWREPLKVLVLTFVNTVWDAYLLFWNTDRCMKASDDGWGPRWQGCVYVSWEPTYQYLFKGMVRRFSITSMVVVPATQKTTLSSAAKTSFEKRRYRPLNIANWPVLKKRPERPLHF